MDDKLQDELLKWIFDNDDKRFTSSNVFHKMMNDMFTSMFSDDGEGKLLNNITEDDDVQQFDVKSIFREEFSKEKKGGDTNLEKRLMRIKTILRKYEDALDEGGVLEKDQYWKLIVAEMESDKMLNMDSEDADDEKVAENIVLNYHSRQNERNHIEKEEKNEEEEENSGSDEEGSWVDVSGSDKEIGSDSEEFKWLGDELNEKLITGPTKK